MPKTTGFSGYGTAKTRARHGHLKTLLPKMDVNPTFSGGGETKKKEKGEKRETRSMVSKDSGRKVFRGLEWI